MISHKNAELRFDKVLTTKSQDVSINLKKLYDGTSLNSTADYVKKVATRKDWVARFFVIMFLFVISQFKRINGS